MGDWGAAWMLLPVFLVAPFAIGRWLRYAGRAWEGQMDRHSVFCHEQKIRALSPNTGTEQSD